MQFCFFFAVKNQSPLIKIFFIVERELRKKRIRKKAITICGKLGIYGPEVESSRTFLASRAHFEVVGLGLEAYKSSKMYCSRLEDSIVFWLVENKKNQT